MEDRLTPALYLEMTEATPEEYAASRVGEVLAAGMEYGALGGIVSGSGPTTAFLVDDNEAGIDLAVALTASGVVRDVRRASGPVHGAHVIHHRID